MPKFTEGPHVGQYRTPVKKGHAAVNRPQAIVRNWGLNFAELMAFKEQHGHTHVPSMDGRYQVRHSIWIRELIHFNPSYAMQADHVCCFQIFPNRISMHGSCANENDTIHWCIQKFLKQTSHNVLLLKSN